MNTEERVKEAIEVFRKVGVTPELNRYLQKLREEDQLAFSVMEVYLSLVKHQYALAVRMGARLLQSLKGNPWLKCRLFISIGRAHRGIGEIGLAESWFMRTLEMAEFVGDNEAASQARLQLYITRFLKAEYEQAYKEFLKYRKDPNSWRPQLADYFLSVLAVANGQPADALSSLNRFLAVESGDRDYYSVLEIKALAFRVLGKLNEAMKAFVESATGYISYGSAYSASPLAKALEISRLAGLEPPPRKLIRKALALAKKGSWGEQAAAQEIEALLRENDSEAAEGLYEAAKNYLRAYQNIEGVLSGLTAAYLAWRSDSPVFTKSLKLIAPLVPMFPGLRKDPLVGDFMLRVEPILFGELGVHKDSRAIRAYLIGELRVTVDGKPIEVSRWHNVKALTAFIYLLLSPKHRIPVDHLFYLLWPRRIFNRRNKRSLYTAMNLIRKRLGNPDLVTHRGDFYQLEEAWTDLEELENLIRLADATTDAAEKEEYLARARELARGELLPEFPYDKHIEEYRQYYDRLRKRLAVR